MSIPYQKVDVRNRTVKIMPETIMFSRHSSRSSQLYPFIELYQQKDF